jgi:AraC-like DNA-binding protein
MARLDPRNIAHYWYDRHTPGLSLMHADFHTQEYAPHRHEAFVIAITELGGSVIKSRGVVEQADASALFVFNPAETQSSWMGASRHWRYRSLYLEESAVDEIVRGLGIGSVPYFTRNLFADRDLLAQFLSLHRTLEEGRDALRERELLIATFGTLFGRHGSGCRPIQPAPRDRILLKAAIELIRDRMSEKLPLEAISNTLGLTQYQLISLFKRTIGLTPHAYVTQVRLDAACRYLARGVPLAEAALAAGFYDQSALTKHFKRRYGFTPLQFARAAQGDRR